MTYRPNFDSLKHYMTNFKLYKIDYILPYSKALYLKLTYFIYQSKSEVQYHKQEKGQ